jgi:uncharacterized protein YbdZ (MbtH family)
MHNSLNTFDTPYRFDWSNKMDAPPVTYEPTPYQRMNNNQQYIVYEVEEYTAGGWCVWYRAQSYDDALHWLEDNPEDYGRRIVKAQRELVYSNTLYSPIAP